MCGADVDAGLAMQKRDRIDNGRSDDAHYQGVDQRR